MKIYTRTGDDGTTGLFSGERVSKTHGRVEAYGAVDEVNSLLGLARALSPVAAVDSWILEVQRQLFSLGADLATCEPCAHRIVRIREADIFWLETRMDEMTARLPGLRHFILPGGTPAAAQIHVARATARRAERAALHVDETLNPHALVYLNRLSDFLFTLARYENLLAGKAETEWSGSQ